MTKVFGSIVEQYEQTLITVLFVENKVSDFAETVKVGQMKLKSIDITLGLIPGISITIS